METSAPARAIWLHLLRQGGFHSTGEISKALSDTTVFANLYATVAEMARSGAVIKRGQQYGVTVACRVPRGVSVGDVTEALSAQEAAC